MAHFPLDTAKWESWEIWMTNNNPVFVSLDEMNGSYEEIFVNRTII